MDQPSTFWKEVRLSLTATMIFSLYSAVAAPVWPV